MSGGIGLTSSSANRSQILHTAQGIISDPGPFNHFATATAPTSQTVYGSLVGLKSGDLVKGVLFRNQVAASGTAPTTARFGIATAAGVVKAVSANVNAAETWATGAVAIPFSDPYAVPSDGGYYLCFVVNGTWSVTQPTPVRTGALAVAGAAYSTYAAPSFLWAGQTDLPAVDASLTISTQGGLVYYLAAY